MNMSVLSRADLVRELLAPAIFASSAIPLHVSDAVAPIAMNDMADSVLAHRLGVARELLLRDLREQMSNSPVMSSPQVLRAALHRARGRQRVHRAGL